MIGTVEDRDMPVPATTQPTQATPPTEVALVHADNRVALYKHHPNTSAWHRILTGTEDEAATIRATLETADATIREYHDMVHLFADDGFFPETVTTFANPTAVQVLRGEAALLRKQATNRRTDAAFGGEYGDRGASGLDAVADAYEHAIAVFERHAR